MPFTATTVGTRARRRGDLASEVRRSTRFAVASLLASGLVGLAIGSGLILAQSRAVEAAKLDHRLGEIHHAMLDAETGLRGYQLTRDRSFLEPYVSGTAALDQLDSELSGAVARDPRLTALWTDTLRASQAWRLEWAEPILEAGGVRPPGQPFDGGRRRFDDYRAARAELDAALEGRVAAAITAQRMLLVAGVAFSAAVASIAIVVTWRRGTALSRAIVGPVHDLLETVRRLGAGELVARTSGGGPEELRRIGDGLTDAAVALELERQRSRASEEESRRRATDLETLLDLSRTLTTATDLDEVLLVAARAAQARFHAAAVRVWVVEKDGLRAATSLGTSKSAVSKLADRALLESTVLQEHRPQGTALAIRMSAAGRLVGVVECLGTPGELAPADVGVLEAMAMSTGAAVRSARLHAETRELSRRDNLTGLLNRRVLDADLIRHVRHSRRHGTPFSVVLLDVDHFKSLNDQHGHAFGDDVLATLGRTLAAGLRDGDEAYRYGGEEFAILLRDTSADQALMAAERLRSAVRRTFDGVLADRDITASFGIADLESANDAATLLGAADDALYTAKKRGRDRCVVTGRRAAAPERRLRAVASPA